MQVTVLFFGPLIEVTGVRTVTLENVADTKSLTEQLRARYPDLASMQYLIAVDKEIVKENAILSNESTVALLPPYAGG